MNSSVIYVSILLKYTHEYDVAICSHLIHDKTLHIC